MTFLGNILGYLFNGETAKWIWAAWEIFYDLF